VDVLPRYVASGASVLVEIGISGIQLPIVDDDRMINGCVMYISRWVELIVVKQILGFGVIILLI